MPADHSQPLDKLNDECPVRAALDVIRGRWKPTILRELHRGTKRFTEMREAMGNVTAQALSVQLRQLESDGIVVRTVYAEIPARVEYELSEFGQTLGQVMEGLESWGEGYLQRRRQRSGRSQP